MCGLSGLALRSWDPAIAGSFVALSEEFMERRGPDGFNVKRITPSLLFTHARLAIIDLAGGIQPMSDDEGDLILNGEVYNYRELKDPSITYSTKSDTEVLLKGLNQAGAAYLERVDGMFAFAHYDRRTRRLTLGRDRFGIKPLYYFFDGQQFAFASRLQPLMMFSRKEIDRRALADYYLTRACRGARTVFTDIIEVLPGEAIVFDIENFTIVEKKKWAAPLPAPRDKHNVKELLPALDETMKLAVARHMVADVPVATFLSGGVDSGLVTAMAALLRPDLSSFSIGFNDKAYDESDYASSICRQYHVRHHVRYCDAPEFMNYMEVWPSVVDDVVADPSAVLLYIIAQFARDMGYKVALTGEGADEFFGGYNQYYRFQLARQLYPYMRHIPGLLSVIGSVKGNNSRYMHYARMAIKDPHYYGTGMIFEPFLIHSLVEDGTLETVRTDNFAGALELDLHHRLPDDVLTRTDRPTMYASIETRVPFLTKYVGEFSRTLREDMLINGRTQKFLLKKLAERYIPHECIYRPKVGFDVPLARWFREELKPMMMDVLSSTWQTDYLVKGAMDKVIQDHLAGRNDNADKIWSFVLLDGNVRHLRSINGNLAASQRFDAAIGHVVTPVSMKQSHG